MLLLKKLKTKMMTKGWKAGIGTSSRIAPSIGGAVGVLVLSNFYPPPGLVMDGVAMGAGGDAVGAGLPQPVRTSRQVMTSTREMSGRGM